MPGRKRTRPKGSVGAFGTPYPGCCRPFPDATFVNERLVKLYAHHQGPSCRGYLESMSMEEWHAEIDARSRARRNDR